MFAILGRNIQADFFFFNGGAKRSPEQTIAIASRASPAHVQSLNYVVRNSGSVRHITKLKNVKINK
jgi:hypothetical protein